MNPLRTIFIIKYVKNVYMYMYKNVLSMNLNDKNYKKKKFPFWLNTCSFIQ